MDGGEPRRNLHTLQAEIFPRGVDIYCKPSNQRGLSSQLTQDKADKGLVEVRKKDPSNGIDFLVATPKVATCTEAARVQPDKPKAPAHDAFTRLLHRLEPAPAILWEEVRPFVHLKGGVLMLDDSVLDKFYAHHMGLVGRFWSGKHRRVVQGAGRVRRRGGGGELQRQGKEKREHVGAGPDAGAQSLGSFALPVNLGPGPM